MIDDDETGSLTGVSTGNLGGDGNGPGGHGPRSVRKIVVGAAVALAALLTTAFFVRAGGKAATAAASTAPAGNDAPVIDGKFIRFSPAFVQRAGIKAEAARIEELAPFIQVNGTLTYDPQKFAALGARIDGRLRRVFKLAGDQVKAGEIVAEIESAELGRTEAAALAARAREHAAEADMKRERRLADAKVTAERDAELARAGYEAVRAERIAAERAAHALGGDLDAELGVFVLRSPMAGRIVTADVARGKTVHPTDTLFEIADLDTLWVELRVFERDLAQVRAGDRVELVAQNAGAPVPGLAAQVAHVGDVIDPGTRTGAVRVVVGNRARALRPGQSITARIHTTAPATRGLSVATRAVTRIDGKPTVFVLHDATTVEPRVVTTAVEDRDRVAVLEGLAVGDQVVTDGMFALKSEIFR